MNELRDLTERLDTAGKQVYSLQTEVDELEEQLDPVTVEYEEVFNDLLTTLIDNHEADGKKLPGEDARNALVTRQMRLEHGDLYGRHKRLTTDLAKKRRELKRKEKFAQNIQSQIMSKQSSLSYLKTEMQAVGA